MRHAGFSDEVLVRYLLGDLPEGERERVEERFFQDDEFFQRLEIIEGELFDDYAQGGLSEVERGRFAAQFLAGLHGRRRLSIQKSVTDVVLEETPAEAPAEPEPGEPQRRQSLLRSLFAPGRAWQLAYAGLAAVLFMAGVWLFVENKRLRSSLESERAALRQREQELQQQAAAQRGTQDAERRAHAEQLDEARRREQAERERNEQLSAQLREGSGPGRSGARDARTGGPAALAVAAYVFSVNPVRSTYQQEKPLVIRRGQKSVNFRIDLDDVDYPGYRVSVQTVEGQEIWGGTVSKGDRRLKGKSITLPLRADIFTEPRYILSVSPVTAAGQADSIADHSFRVIRED